MSYLRKVVDLMHASQSEKVSEKQVKNNAGGFSFKVDKWEKLRRFLIIGTEGGTYYQGERGLSLENLDNVRKCIKEDGPRVVKITKGISVQGRAPKNDQALLVLAVATVSGNTKTKTQAYEALPSIARIGTHLYQFAEFRKLLNGGWGNGMRKAVSKYYTDKDDHKLALHAVKYRQRNGWSHSDMLRLAHPKTDSEVKQAIYQWMLKDSISGKTPPFLIAASELMNTDNVNKAVELIKKYKLPHEAIPTEIKAKKEIWEALLPDMPIGALVRNLANMTRYGLIAPMSDSTKLAIKKLNNRDEVKYSRIHPINVLIASTVYAKGVPVKGKGEHWTPVKSIIDALEDTFYLAFKNARPTHKNIMLAIDVSGSMNCPANGAPTISCRALAGAMAMTTAKTEQLGNYMFTGFYGGNRGMRGFFDRRASDESDLSGINPLAISEKNSLSEVLSIINKSDFGHTDCSLPMKYALHKKIPVEAFVIYTDSETWSGKPHPHTMIKKYRDKTGIPAKMIVVGMAANNFTIADPDDAGMLDIVGFDSAVPQLISDFIIGE